MPKMCFVCSMSDLFHEDVPFRFIAEVFTTMAMAQTRGHTFQVLTKRPHRLREFFDWNYPPGKMDPVVALKDWLACWPNVWLGTSCEDQERADERTMRLLETPAAVHFLSCEPLLGPLCPFEALCPSSDPGMLDWVIVGAESGPRARPMKLDWARYIVQRCQERDVPVFVKQLCDDKGRKIPFEEWPEDLRVREWPKCVSVGVRNA